VLPSDDVADLLDLCRATPGTRVKSAYDQLLFKNMQMIQSSWQCWYDLRYDGALICLLKFRLLPDACD